MVNVAICRCTRVSSVVLRLYHLLLTYQTWIDQANRIWRHFATYFCHKCLSLAHLLKLFQVYDGVRRRALPILLDALKPGTEDDRMKGALWTLDLSSFGKYAIAGNSEVVHDSNLSDIQNRTYSCQRSSLGAIWMSTSRKGTPFHESPNI